MRQPDLPGNKRMSKAVDFDRPKNTKKYEPKPIMNMADFRNEAVSILGKRAGVFSGAGRNFVTFGSCFATHVADYLNRNGVRVYTTCVTEDVNSPFNNRLLLRRVFLKERCQFVDELHSITSVDYDELAREFSGATDIIFTLGNIFHLSDGVAMATPETKLERETYSETVNCIREIVELLTAHTKARLFVSVSPVSISGYRGHEFTNAIEADCFSKCQLMAAIKTLYGFTYIPTFEIFRWLSAHKSFPTFGEDNGNARHIFRDQIAMVMGALC